MQQETYLDLQERVATINVRTNSITKTIFKVSDIYVSLNKEEKQRIRSNMSHQLLINRKLIKIILLQNKSVCREFFMTVHAIIESELKTLKK